MNKKKEKNLTNRKYKESSQNASQLTLKLIFSRFFFGEFQKKKKKKNSGKSTLNI